MKTLFIGGVKSGKSQLAEHYILTHCAQHKPYYLATTEFLDDEMRARIAVHQARRQDKFITLEEPLHLLSTLKTCRIPVLVECTNMWLNNAMYHHWPETQILQELETIMHLPTDLVLVHNEVGQGIIPDNALARQFVDLSGKAAQLMARYCDKVFFCSAGLALPMK
jgi:adenosylcobinamide kinase / adenosylcobinamide-phosphate guanylyltransferase